MKSTGKPCSAKKKGATFSRQFMSAFRTKNRPKFWWFPPKIFVFNEKYVVLLKFVVFEFSDFIFAILISFRIKMTFYYFLFKKYYYSIKKLLQKKF